MAGFNFDAGDAIERLGVKLAAQMKEKDKTMLKNMTKAIELIYKTAIRKRPSISNKDGRKVSDPKAESGVPVDTGRLRDSIKKEVHTEWPNAVVGSVFVDTKIAPYGKFVEYGTSKMQARPFMRPALDMNKEKIKNIFKEK